MVGGICALIGAKMLGPRIGKFTKDKDGKIVKVNAIPRPHPLRSARWACSSCGSAGTASTARHAHETLRSWASIFFTTTVAPAVATVRHDDLYLDQIRQARCFDVLKRLPGGSGRHHGQLRRDRLLRRDRHRRCFRYCWWSLACGCSTTSSTLTIPSVRLPCISRNTVSGARWQSACLRRHRSASQPDGSRRLLQGPVLRRRLGAAGAMQCIGVLSVAAWTAVTITITFCDDQKDRRPARLPRGRDAWPGFDRAWSAQRLCRLCQPWPDGHR